MSEVERSVLFRFLMFQIDNQIKLIYLNGKSLTLPDIS